MAIKTNISAPAFSAGSIFLLILSIPFALIGTFTAYQVIQTIAKTFVMQGWPTVPAIIQSAELENSGKSSRAKATYTYQVDGKQYSGHRVSLYSPDNLGSFHERTYNDLEQHLNSKTPFPAHVDPQDPNESILLPVLRFEVIGFQLIFVIVFGALGWALLIGSVIGIRRAKLEAALAKQYPDEPWRHRLCWSTPRIKSTQSSLAIAIVAVALLWNAVSLPILLVIPRELAQGHYFVLFILLFPIIGMGLGWWAGVATARAKRFGKTYFELSTIPVRPGEELKGMIVAPKALEGAEAAKIKFVCERSYRTTGSDGKRTTKTEVLWKKELSAPVIKGQSAAGDALIKLSIQTPTGFPDSSNQYSEDFTWKLSASAELKGADFAAEFELPVFSRSASQVKDQDQAASSNSR